MTTKMAMTAAATATAIWLVSVGSTLALPGAAVRAPVAAPDIILVEGGCGPGLVRGPGGRCYPPGRPVVVAPVAPAVIVAPAVVAPAAPVVVAPVVCGAGFRWHPGFRRCVVL